MKKETDGKRIMLQFWTVNYGHNPWEKELLNDRFWKYSLHPERERATATAALLPIATRDKPVAILCLGKADGFYPKPL